MADDAARRIEELEFRVVGLEADLAALSKKVSVEAERFRTAFPEPVRLPEDPVASMPPPPTADSRIRPTASPAPTTTPLSPPITPRQWFEVGGERALRWTGVLLVVLAVGFAVSTAISRGWIGPELQLVGALGISSALIGGGLHLRTSRILWTHALCSGGVLALFSTVASSLFIDQFEDSTAYLSTAAIGLVGYALARHVPSPWVAGSSLLGSMAGWLVIADGAGPFVASLTWVSVAVFAALLVSVERSWFLLRVIAQVVGAVGGLVFAIGADTPAREALVMVAAGALFAAMAWVPSLGRETSIWRELETQLVLLAPSWAFLVSTSALDVDGEREAGGVAVAVALVSLAIALVVFAKVRRAHFLSMLIGASVTFSFGLALLLSPTATFLALAVQAAGLVVLARSFRNEGRLLLHAAALEVIVVGGLTAHLVEAWGTDAPVGDDVVRAATIAALAVGAGLSQRRQMLQLGVVTVLAMTMIWLGSVLVHLPQGQALVSLSWAALGTLVLLAGSVKKVPALGALGLGVIAITVGKLLTVDLREVDTLWRAALFLVVGLGIMRLGFLLPRLTAADDKGDRDRPAPPRPIDPASAG